VKLLITLTLITGYFIVPVIAGELEDELNQEKEIVLEELSPDEEFIDEIEIELELEEE